MLNTLDQAAAEKRLDDGQIEDDQEDLYAGLDDDEAVSQTLRSTIPPERIPEGLEARDDPSNHADPVCTFDTAKLEPFSVSACSAKEKSGKGLNTWDNIFLAKDAPLGGLDVKWMSRQKESIAFSSKEDPISPSPRAFRDISPTDNFEARDIFHDAMVQDAFGKTPTTSITHPHYDVWLEKLSVRPPWIPAPDLTRLSKHRARPFDDTILFGPEDLNIYVGGLRDDTNDRLLRLYGQKFGAIIGAKAMMRRGEARCIGYGFICFQRSVDAQKCWKAFAQLGYYAEISKKQMLPLGPQTKRRARRNPAMRRQERSHITIDDAVSAEASSFSSPIPPQPSTPTVAPDAMAESAHSRRSILEPLLGRSKDSQKRLLICAPGVAKPKRQKTGLSTAPGLDTAAGMYPTAVPGFHIATASGAVDTLQNLSHVSSKSAILQKRILKPLRAPEVRGVAAKARASTEVTNGVEEHDDNSMDGMRTEGGVFQKTQVPSVIIDPC